MAEYEAEIDEYVSRDEDLQDHVERLERLLDEEATEQEEVRRSMHPADESGSAARLVAEVEEFLRDQGPEA